MFWILRGILGLLEVPHSLLWFGVNSSAGCGCREDFLQTCKGRVHFTQGVMDLPFWSNVISDCSNHFFCFHFVLSSEEF
uniref:Secreted protein n=1 Tax=Zonotrichia albicollis TaxID=44394 RepID=A0A8D2MTN4_ZONAL